MVALSLFAGAGLFLAWQALKAPETNVPITTTITARPLLWVDEDAFLIGKGNVVSLYNVNIKSQHTVYEVRGDKVTTRFASSCFAKTQWVLDVSQLIGDRNHTSWLVINWTDPKNPSETTLDFSRVQVNRIDCLVRERKSPPETVSLSGEDWVLAPRISYGPNTFYVASDRADQLAVYKRGNRFLVALFKADEVKYVRFDEGTLPRGLEIESSYDRQVDRYFWYTLTHQFDASTSSRWPLQAWWLGKDSSIQFARKLPAGPWVQEYSTLKKLSCFACGCSCFSNFRVHAVNNRLFALVWGKGVVDGQSGIYELIETSPTSHWKKLDNEQSETTANMIFSPSGCKLAYSFGPVVKLLNVCPGPT